MVNLGGKLISLDQTFSIPQLNQKFITRMTGEEISNHNAAGEPLNILCIEDGAGYLNGHFYVIGEDGIVRDVFAEHLHTNTSTGGSLYDIYRANYKELVEIDMSLNIFAAAFIMTRGSTGTLIDDTDPTALTKYVQLLTAATNNDWVSGLLGGGRLWFNKPITLQLKYAVSHNTSITYRMGIGSPAINNAIDVVPQFGFEGCTGTDQLNRVYSSDGTAYHAEPMLNMVQSFPMGLRADFYPSSKIIVDDGEGTHFNKTTNLPPPSTATNSNNVFRGGVRTLTGATRNLKIYALRIVGSSYDSASGVKGWC